MERVIYGEEAPEAVGLCSQTIEANGMVFMSGQLPIDTATGQMAERIEGQTRQPSGSIEHILEEVGLTVGDIIKTTVFLRDMSLFAEVNSAYVTYFDGAFPTRPAVAIRALPKDALVEIGCIAVH